MDISGPTENPLSWLKDAKNVDTWDGGKLPNSFREFLNIQGDENDGYGFAYEGDFSADGRRMLIRDTGNRLTVIETATGKVLCSLDKIGDAQVVRLSPDGERIAAAIYEKEVTIWNVGDGRKVCTLDLKFGHDKGRAVSDMRFSPDGRQIIVAVVFNDIVRLYDASSGKALYPFKEQIGHNIGIAFSRDGGLIGLSDHLSGMVRVYKSGALVREFHVEDKEAIRETLEFSPSSKTFLYGGQHDSLKLMDAETGKVLRIFIKENAPGYFIDYFYWHPWTPVTFARLTPRGDYVYALLWSRDKDIVGAWSVLTGKQLAYITMPKEIKRFNVLGIYEDALYLVVLNDAGATRFLRVPLV